MLKKTLKVLFFLAVLGMSANANDLLANISKGAISDSSLGVKVLNPEQMSEVRGGYISDYITSGNIGLAIATPNPYNELLSNGLCPMGETVCYANPTTKTHSDIAIQRMANYKDALDGHGYSSYTHALSFIVIKEYQNGAFGSFPVFKYMVAAYNLQDDSIHPINSSTIMSNPIVMELRNQYQRIMERELGGLR